MSVARRACSALIEHDVPGSENQLLSGFRVHRVGVEIDERVDQRTWYEFGRLVQQVDYARDWIIADWLAFGEHRYGDRIYQSAASLFGKSSRTWEDYAYIARNVRCSERSEILPALLHKPIARFSDRPTLQRALIAIAEEHSLSKNIFEAVIELYLERQSYEHLLPTKITPVTRARMRAEKERERVLKRVIKSGERAWLEFVREQASAWSLVLEEIEGDRAYDHPVNRKKTAVRYRAIRRVAGTGARTTTGVPS